MLELFPPGKRHWREFGISRRYTMPEGPEVRRYAAQLALALENQPIRYFTARTRQAKAWLLEHGGKLEGRRIERVASHGKHIYGRIEGGFGFHSHLMMWGRWFVHPADEIIEVDRRERARIDTPGGIAILFSAPVFDVFEGDPYTQIENLATLGPDILPYDGEFNTASWRSRLLTRENSSREIGAVLLDQRVCAGIGNYLRADILFFCRIDPWKKVGELTAAELDCLDQEIPLVAQRSLLHSGVSVPAEMRVRLEDDPSLSYNGQIREYGTHHAVFRRTNLPCLVCGNPVRQSRQVTYRTPDGDSENEPENEMSRIIYFCPHCQNVAPEHGPKSATPKKKRGAVKTALASGN